MEKDEEVIARLPWKRNVVFFDVLFQITNLGYQSDEVYVLDSSSYRILSGIPREGLTQSIRSLAE